MRLFILLSFVLVSFIGFSQEESVTPKPVIVEAYFVAELATKGDAKMQSQFVSDEITKIEQDARYSREEKNQYIQQLEAIRKKYIVE